MLPLTHALLFIIAAVFRVEEKAFLIYAQRYYETGLLQVNVVLFYAVLHTYSGQRAVIQQNLKLLVFVLVMVFDFAWS